MVVLKKNQLRNLAIISTLVAPLVFLSSELKPWQTQNPYVLVFEDVIFGMESLWHTAVRTVESRVHRFLYLAGSAEENERLRQTIKVLRTRLIDYEEQAAESNRLRRLLGFSQRFGHKVQVAEVLGAASPHPFYALRITSGHGDGLDVGLPVVTESGVVGRLLRLGRNFSDVQLLTDRNFNLDVMVERTRLRGVLHGIADSRCRLQLHRQADIRIGDTIVTSGITGSFPNGLPVGQVVRISYEADDVSQLITIQPWVDYHGLEEVLVLVKAANKEIDIIRETAGSEWITKVL